MTMSSYKRPPILEAVIDVQFKTALKNVVFNKFCKKLAKKYPVVNEVYRDIGIVVEISKDVTKAHALDNRTTGSRFESHDSEWVIILYPKQFSFIRLAPYIGWDKFLDEFKAFWKIFKQVSDSKALSRLAVRYVNRIDIPLDKGVNSINIADYLNVGVNTPEDIIIDGYETVFKVNVDESYSAIVRTATDTQAIPKTAALLLDVDLFTYNSLSQKDEGIYEQLLQLRDKKNELFEKFITPKSRELFDREIV